MNSATATVQSIAAAVLTTIAIPPINAYWTGRGGKFRGIVRGETGQRDYLLIEHVDELPIGDWKSSIEAAAGVEVDGHKDFSLPNRAESALLYANAKDEHEDDDWYWTSEQHAELSDWAWLQDFNDGYQYLTHECNDYRARAVRRIPI